MTQDDLLQRLSGLDTCAVSDALDSLGLRGATVGIRPLWDCGRIVGRVVTVKIKPVGLDRPKQHLAATAIDAARAGDVIVIDNAGRQDVSAWGGLLSLASKLKGLSGVIIDGACRDIDESRSLGFPVFGRAVVPVTARGRIMQESVNQDIQCGGVLVQPGDLVIADGSGVVFIPARRAEEVIAAAERVAEREQAMAEALRSGRTVSDVMESLQYEAMLRRDV